LELRTWNLELGIWSLDLTVKQYDLEQRTFKFARQAVQFCRRLPRTTVDGEIIKQLMRAATSVGANYLEATESLGKNDFLMRLKICRKEAKETGYWLRLLEINDSDLKLEKEGLLKESDELARIFGAILTKKQQAGSSKPQTRNSKPQTPNSKP
jgi:four helix bundle protein